MGGRANAENGGVAEKRTILDGQTDIHTNTEVHIEFVPYKKSFFTNVLGQLKEYL